MKFVALGGAGVGVNGDKGRSSSETAKDFAGVDEEGFVGLGDFELVVVAKADDIITAGLGKDPADVVVVSQTKATAVDGNCRHFAVELNVRKGAAVLRDAKEIAVVVAKDEVDVAQVVLAEFVDDEGGSRGRRSKGERGYVEVVLMFGGGRRYYRECPRGCRLAWLCWGSCPPGSSEGEVFGDVDQSVVDFFVQKGDAVVVG